MKKLKTRLIALTKISLICLAFFVFSPSLKAHAMFNDTASINMGIQLELGTVSLGSENTTISKDVRFTDGKPVLISESTLINDGSLTGKIAYKIDVKKEDETDLKAEELQDMSVIIDFGGVANKVTASGTSLNTKKFTFAKDSSSNDVIVEPDSLGILATVNYKNSDPTKDKKLKITVTFRLIQSNATDANTEMFSDEESLTNTVTLVPKVVEEEESYWPKESTFVKANGSKLSYSLEKMDMVFSEVYDKDNPKIKQIRNLNKAFLYIQIPKNEELKTTDKKTEEIIDSFKVISLVADDTGKIKYEKTEIDEVNHGIKITFNLEDSYNSSNPNEVKEYTNKYRYPINIRFQLGKYTSYGQNNSSYEHYSGVYYQKNIFASRLALTSDIPSETKEAIFEQKNILLSKTEKSIAINQIKTLSHDSVKNEEFEDVQWNDEMVSLEVIGEKTGQISSLLNLNTAENPNKTFSLWLKPLKPNETFDSAVLNVKILGDAGNMLVISRTLKNGIQPSSTQATTQYTSRSLMRMPMIVEEAEEPTEQVTDSEKSVEESDSTMDSSVVDESAVEIPIEESDEEKLIDETEVTEEVVDSSSVDSSVESTK